jgi:hypothetical protein
VARQQSDEPRSGAEHTDLEHTDLEHTDLEHTSEADSGRPASVDALWAQARIDVVEIALPGGVGYTLRAYRSDEEVETTDISEREADAFPDRHRPARSIYDHDEKAIQDEDEGADATVDHDFPADFAAEDTPTEDLDEADVIDSDDELDDESDSDVDEESDEEAGEDEDDVEVEAEEIPIFLGYRGKLLLFRSPEGLVKFIKSDAPHDLAQLESWAELADKVSVEDVTPLPEDTYELDLVVNNLRGGRDTWDAELIIRAGEIARDIARSFELEQVENALATGSPLDDLDEALRASVSGGMGGFFGRRRLKKIGTEAAPLGWRTIIGKISSVADWRD